MPGREDIFQKSMNEGHSAAWDQEWGKAAAAYRKALQEMPDNPKALNSLGLALFQQGNYEEALQIYKRVAQVIASRSLPDGKTRPASRAHRASQRSDRRSLPEPQNSSSISVMSTKRWRTGCA